MALTKRYWVLIGILVLVAFVGGMVVYLGWSKQKSRPASLQSEQFKPEPMKRIAIPSSLAPIDVITQFVPYLVPVGGGIGKESGFWNNFNLVQANDGFEEGFLTAWLKEAYYIKRDGTKVEALRGDPYGLILYLAVLKYKTSQLAQEDYEKISMEQKFENFTLREVNLKTKMEAPPALWPLITKKSPSSELKTEEYQQYLLHSNNFIIYAYGLKEAAEDFMIRLIDRYTVE
jgi:hypothetical protein